MKVKMKGCTNAKSCVIRDSIYTKALKKPGKLLNFYCRNDVLILLGPDFAYYKAESEAGYMSAVLEQKKHLDCTRQSIHVYRKI